MIKGVIFDCFGVLYGGSLEALAAKAPADKRQDAYDVNRAKDYGYIDHQEYLSQLSQIIGISIEEVDGIVSKYHIPNETLMEYSQGLRVRYKTGLLSNIGNDMIDDLFEGRVDDMFDMVLLSYSEGITKPSPEIFLLAADRMGLAPEECVMIDDLISNCEGADVAGMKSIQHVDNALTIAKLEKLLEVS